MTFNAAEEPTAMPDADASYHGDGLEEKVAKEDSTKKEEVSPQSLKENLVKMVSTKLEHDQVGIHMHVLL